VTAGAGILGDNGTRYTSGVVDKTGAYNGFGIVDSVDGTGYGYGVMTDTGVVYAEGVLQNAGADYFTLADTGSTPYLDGAADGAVAGAAAQLVTDAAAVNAELGNMTTAVQNLLHADNDGTLNMGLYTLISGVVVAGNVRNGTARYSGGGNGSCYVPTASQVLSGVNVDATTGNVTLPANGNNVVSGTNFGVNGTSVQGNLTLAGTTYVLSTAPAYGVNGTGGGKTATIPAGANVQSGASAYGINGTSETPSYPTTATAIAADALLVAAQAAFIVQGTDFTGGLGVVGSLAVIDVSDAGTGAAAGGALDLDDYVLITSLPNVKYLYHDIDRGDGNKGALRASTLHSGAGAPGVDLAANILKSGETVDDVQGEYVGSGGGIGVRRGGALRGA
jgi:hypothetical protein